jgi:hypothetical protein
MPWRASWEHINLTGDYVWRPDGGLRKRSLRFFDPSPFQKKPFATANAERLSVP